MSSFLIILLKCEGNIILFFQFVLNFCRRQCPQFNGYLSDFVKGPPVLLNFLNHKKEFHNIPVAYQDMDVSLVPQEFRRYYTGKQPIILLILHGDSMILCSVSLTFFMLCLRTLPTSAFSYMLRCFNVILLCSFILQGTLDEVLKSPDTALDDTILMTTSVVLDFLRLMEMKLMLKLWFKSKYER